MNTSILTKLFSLGEYLAGKKDSRLLTGLGVAFLEACFVAMPFGIALFLLREALENHLNLNYVMWAGIGIFICAVFRIFCSGMAMGYIFNATHALMGYARIRIADHIKKLPMGFFNKRRSGELAGTLTTDIAFVEDVWSHMIGVTASSFFLPLIVGIALCFLDLRLGIITVLSLPLAFLMIMITTPLFIRGVNKVFESIAHTNAHIVEYTQGIAILRAFGRHGDGFTKLTHSMENLKNALIKADVLPSPLLSIFGFVIEASFVATALLGNYFLTQGTLAPHYYLIFLVATLGISKQVADLGTTMLMLRSSEKALNRVESLLNEKPLADKEEIQNIKNFEVSFQNVSFSYEDVPQSDNDTALKNINLTFPQNSMTALVGKSGSGKSTIAQLIPRLYEIEENQGAILIGGVDIRNIPSTQLQNLVSMVFQEVNLFSGSILENIKIGKLDATENEVYEASKAAGAHDFIQALPQGYETILGENGLTLSGGERQRISIARAFLKNAPIILLDEATAAIDASKESEVQRSIDNLVKNKTVIIIAHRLKTIMRASKIVVLDKGMIVETGTHDELLKNDDFYTTLWQEQQRASHWKIS